MDEREVPKQGNWKAHLGVALICIILTSLVTLPFFIIGEVQGSGCCGGAMPVTHDGPMHFNQMQSFWRGLSSGLIYPRWDDLTHAGYGAPNTSFYPPAVYYLTSAIYLVSRDWEVVFIVLHWILMAASGAAIYWYARKSISRGAGILAMAVYLTAPYHLINQYQRGAIAELLGFIWMPMILLFGERLWRECNSHNSSRKKLIIPFAGVAACYGALIWSHPPTAYQFTLVFGLSTGGLFLFSRARSFRALVGILAALLFGSLLAAAYLYPAIAEAHLINSDDVEKRWPYHASYVFDTTQNFYDHSGNDFIPRIDRIWLFNTAALVLTAILFLIFRKEGKARASLSRYWFWITAGVVASFMMTRLSYPVGVLIPKIDTGAFSWRMLSITSLIIALLAGGCWHMASKASADRGKVRSILIRALAISIPVGAIVMSVLYVAMPMYRVQSFSPRPDHFNYATLPRGTPLAPAPMEPAQTTSGTGRISIVNWQPEYRELVLELDQPDQLQFRTSNYPGWTTSVENRIVEIENGPNGNIAIDLPAGNHRVILEYKRTPVRLAGDMITLSSFVLLVAAVIAAKRRKNNEQLGEAF
jgi:6-pyruvoyl-tetrahydropterin synthase related domain